MAPKPKIEYAFDPRHNMCAVLVVNADNQPVEHMIRWMARSNIRFALTTSPTIYRGHILDFWKSAALKTDGERRIEAKVAGREIVITERSIRRCLQFDDDNHYHINFTADHLKKIFDEMMGYQGGKKDGQFEKGMFPLMYRFLIHHIIHGFAPRKGSWTLMSRDLANATVGVMCELPFNFSRMVFDGLVSNLKKKVAQRFL